MPWPFTIPEDRLNRFFRRAETKLTTCIVWTVILAFLLACAAAALAVGLFALYWLIRFIKFAWQ